jgi:hypothetical protein
MNFRPERFKKTKRRRESFGEEKSTSMAGEMNIILLQCNIQFSSNIDRRLRREPGLRWTQQPYYYGMREPSFPQR